MITNFIFRKVIMFLLNFFVMNAIAEECFYKLLWIKKMFNKILFSDKEYLDRIERHYDQFKKTLKTISN